MPVSTETLKFLHYLLVTDQNYVVIDLALKIVSNIISSLEDNDEMVIYRNFYWIYGNAHYYYS